MLDQGMRPSLCTIWRTLRTARIRTVRLLLHRCPWILKTADCSRGIPNVEVVDLLWSSGCELSTETFVETAMLMQSISCVEWGIQHDCIYKPHKILVCRSSDFLEQLFRLGLPLPGWTLEWAWKRLNVKEIVWALRRGFPLSRWCIQNARSLGQHRLFIDCAVPVLLEAGVDLASGSELGQALADARFVRQWTDGLFDRVLFRAASIIQTRWREALANPAFAVCRRRLLREFSGLQKPQGPADK